MADATPDITLSAWGPVEVPGLSARLRRERPRQNRHVSRRGMALKSGFAFTIGNVISGAGNVELRRCRRLIADHEDVHVWQSRWFGPLYPVRYIAWVVSVVLAGSMLWLVRRRSAATACCATLGA